MVAWKPCSQLHEQNVFNVAKHLLIRALWFKSRLFIEHYGSPAAPLILTEKLASVCTVNTY